MPGRHNPHVLLKGCPSAADAPEGQELPFGGVGVWGSQDENQGNEGLVAVGYSRPIPTATQGTGQLSSILGS